jgi:AraC family transcriptional regulator of adaptative response / DNA-3-methyladenine glycosylase II
MSENGQPSPLRRATRISVTTLDADALYPALAARDPRFDGVFFVGVSTTGVYCRPICPARVPRRDRCSFYRTAAAAEAAGFRACFRCRPERAPGSASVDSVSRVVTLAMRRIEAGALDEASIEALAAELGITARHLRRSMRSELGVSPTEVAEARRLALARQLLVETTLPMAEVAYASGFGSVRRFNTLVRERCGRSPSALRGAPKKLAASAQAAESVSLRLDYRPPFDWEALLAFFRDRATPAVELVDGQRYLRTVRIGEHRGWVAVSKVKDRAALRAEVSLSLSGALVPLVARLRRLFDLDAHPAVVAEHLGKDALLAPLVAARPGLRVPGAVSGFEIATRAILGQQVSVAAARTLHGRLAAAFGESLVTPHEGLAALSPEPERIAAASEAELTKLGILASRARTLKALATAVVKKRISLEPAGDEGRFVQALTSLPGIGPWTAHYVALRALGWPDAFPEADLGLLRALGNPAPRAVGELAEKWRPFRAYAALHLWSAGASVPMPGTALRRPERKTS